MKLNETIDEMFMLRERIRGLERQKKETEAQLEALSTQLMSRLNEVGTMYARGTLASATITEQVVPTIDDWGKVSEWVMENDAIYLLHRRISSGAWNELRDAGTDVPGIEPFTKRAVSLKKLGD